MPLIADAVSHGEMKRLSMATACSGTDAPVVAMRVVQETLAQRGVTFDFDHVMSCELEPYKQSFVRAARARINDRYPPLPAVPSPPPTFPAPHPIN